ncbi:histidinol dehydrogenase [Lentilactobacillus buchneri]|uniref:Histidinol dehydrogenase n=1 Tax=Lentilactobacillus buchneri subsp. silagei CD034 TaxID=1071400 RepID=J9VZX8_LENBU|nr:histidinol dehydrogenase [Lentilactobacillus buchneri]MCC6102091.1 histidinol dehydrogenase [Lactobacillus sp.]AFR99763.1 Histidinol dehydrogenase [Lentilactobacillus buchneri subsp. silagei CD034]MCT3543039.1 histidinol dehydrogenase [Lentilactobacillus buchneri]MCT3545212.1 histidinol dehydrogenase [Lentilactobacillus buchneri]MCT3553774.1 histidinol dehydrogenase [Lentilactobacillus buchneri]
MQIIEDSLDQLLKQVAIRTNAVANREEVEKSVREIIANVIKDGDQAVKMYEQKFDNVELESLKVTQREIDDAYEATDDTVIKALELAKANITSFHQMEVEDSFIDAKKKGVIRGEKIAPLAAVGLYVPGGTAAYPSSILMNVIPAKIAGVSRIVMVTPPQKDGLNKAVLAAAKIAGVDEIYTVGGAQAIASLAYGTETVPRVDKITGPGNVFVATAKKQVFGQVDIDMIAGPSEIGVIAGSQAVPSQVAADLLSQAEHDKLARPILVTDDRSLAEAVSKEMDRQVDLLPRKEIAKAAMENEGFIAVVDDIDDAFTLMNAVAPEHLEVQLPDAIEYLNQIKNAGSVFLGFSASEPLGDYLAGPNHILPTGGTARFFSPLGVQDFVKRTQFVSYTRDALKKEKDAITTLARVEGLEAHARAIESRFDD